MCYGPRLLSRALLLIALATVRGVYAVLEQPLSSTAKFYPDLLHVASAIQRLLGGHQWLRQFVWEAQVRMVW